MNSVRSALLVALLFLIQSQASAMPLKYSKQGGTSEVQGAVQLETKTGKTMDFAQGHVQVSIEPLNLLKNPVRALSERLLRIKDAQQNEFIFRMPDEAASSEIDITLTAEQSGQKVKTVFTQRSVLTSSNTQEENARCHYIGVCEKCSATGGGKITCKPTVLGCEGRQLILRKDEVFDLSYEVAMTSETGSAIVRTIPTQLNVQTVTQELERCHL